VKKPFHWWWPAAW